ncbi:putative bifunctional diguanylate cyclase/phosphodiesterase [Mesorhizobium sp. A556]
MTQGLTALVDRGLRKQLELSEEELRALYRQEGDTVRRTDARKGLWLAVAVYLLFAGTDILLIPDVAVVTVAARLVVAVLVLAAIEMQVRAAVHTEWLDITCAAAIISGYVGWLIPALATAYTQNLSYYMIFGAIFMMGANLFFSFRFAISIISSSTIFVIFFVALSFFSSSVPYTVTLGTFYLSCFMFTSFVNWKLNKERYKVFLNALEAKAQHREATERGKALLRLSRTDPLTNLQNRRAVDEKLQEYWSNWQHDGKSFVAVLIDVDFFKRFNDYYGHQEGDRCLVVVANALSATIARYDGSIGRYGGEEFIVLAHLRKKKEVVALVEEIRRAVEELTVTHEHRRDGTAIVTVSVGASLTRQGAAGKLEKIIHEADRALYLAKASGRNCARLFDPDDPESSDESENIAALLKIAVDQRLVSLVYQPILDVASGRVEAAEALMRLTTFDGTVVPPSQFIPVAERTGAILELGRWALRTACRELLADNDIGVVSVNVSPIQLASAGFASSVAAILGETGASGNRLAFEITEGIEMDMRSNVLRCIGDLKLLGIRIWLDDFGTGFAGLSWLRLIDFDVVKIDRSFINGSSDAKGRTMLQDIVGLVRNRGPRILAEGVEREDQMALIRELGIDQAQGYHIGWPTPAENFRIQLGNRHPPKSALQSA